MKVILLRDVAKIGRRFEIKEVPDGFALNKLIPQKYAEAATPANVKRIMERNKNDVLHTSLKKETAEAIAQACALKPLVIPMEANDQGHLFQGVHASDVVKSAQTEGLSIDPASLKFAEPIKSLGDHSVSLVVGAENHTLAITVVAKDK